MIQKNTLSKYAIFFRLPYKNVTICIAFLFSFLCSNAQNEPFNCDFNAYLFQFNDVYAVDLASGSSYLVGEDITPGTINGVAYNPADGYLWGSVSQPSSSIIRIGKDFTVTIYSYQELPSSNRFVGGINPEGIYYSKSGGTTYYIMDLNPDSPTHLQYLGTGTLSQNINVHDWAFNAVDGKLYTVEKNTNHLYRIDAATGIVDDLGEVPILSGLNYTYGAVFFDVDGNFYVSANQTGTVYIINNVQTASDGNIASNLFAFGPSSSNNDGARCPTAPVPQEDCINGIDDDGDGLVDCDDPSCSGVSSCPVITPVPTGNDGGLESNDRLANFITNRNYNRAKENYVFDKSSAPIITRGLDYNIRMSANQNGANNNAILEDLIPLGVINETSAIKSSPEDLLNLTNASEIYSVDYLNNDENIAALLAIKTDNQVYEHSKFICDRFLGAELLSVSTIQLRGYSFIKSRIKQADGTLEFALSFSARYKDDRTFTIESHWNIDRYKRETSFYNFQIWANSLDNLYKLGDEILNLLEANSEINEYISSNPPPVFVKKASYENGAIAMELINNNFTNNIHIQGGIKRTETSEVETIAADAVLGGYLNALRVETGSLFDMGFRISNENDETPDDLFVADAPWGLDDSAISTSIEEYEVIQNTTPYEGDVYPIERNIHLRGTTSDYLGVYRAFNPRFRAVDLSAYNNITFEAYGTGVLEITLLKSQIENYEDQFKAQVLLSEENKEFNISTLDFSNGSGETPDFSDLKVIIFNLKAIDGTLQTKALDLSNISFNTISKNIVENTNISKHLLTPNPVLDKAIIYFEEEISGSYEFNLYTMSGRRISSYSFSGDTTKGRNEIKIEKRNLQPGIYFYEIITEVNPVRTGKMIIR